MNNTATVQIDVNDQDHIRECEACGDKYDYRDEPAEVKEGGTYMCPDCWNQEE